MFYLQLLWHEQLGQHPENYSNKCWVLSFLENANLHDGKDNIILINSTVYRTLRHMSVSVCTIVHYSIIDVSPFRIFLLRNLKIFGVHLDKTVLQWKSISQW